MNSKIIIEDIWLEDLFDWFYNNIKDSGGDGCGAIVCKNFKEASEIFLQWYKKQYNKDWPSYLVKEESNNMINFHDWNENFIFTNDSTINFYHGDYIFFIKKDCVSNNGEKRIIAI